MTSPREVRASREVCAFVPSGGKNVPSGAYCGKALTCSLSLAPEIFIICECSGCHAMRASKPGSTHFCLRYMNLNGPNPWPSRRARLSAVFHFIRISRLVERFNSLWLFLCSLGKSNQALGQSLGRSGWDKRSFWRNLVRKVIPSPLCLRITRPLDCSAAIWNAWNYIGITNPPKGLGSNHSHTDNRLPVPLAGGIAIHIWQFVFPVFGTPKNIFKYLVKTGCIRFRSRDRFLAAKAGVIRLQP